MQDKYTVFGQAMTPEEYSEQWALDSGAFSRALIYDWMCSQLGERKLIVEVGCGTGHGTLALSKTAKVICVEPNMRMAEVTRDFLVQNGTSCQLSSNLDGWQENHVTILCDDLIDAKIENVLAAVEADAITCWLIGAEPARIAQHVGKKLHEFDGEEMPEYRQLIHRRCYELGARILPEGGVVHVVDRLFIKTWRDRDLARHGMNELHRELAGDSYDVPFETIRFERYKQPFSNSQIQLMAEGNPEGMVTVFASVRSILRGD